AVPGTAQVARRRRGLLGGRARIVPAARRADPRARKGPVVTGTGDAASVSVLVRVAPADAFDVFTREIDLWWQQGPQFRVAGRRRGQLFFECGAGGGVLATFEGARGPGTLDVGKVTLWAPPRRRARGWRAGLF